VPQKTKKKKKERKKRKEEVKENSGKFLPFSEWRDILSLPLSDMAKGH
jgi:hypothetical protein